MTAIYWELYGQRNTLLGQSKLLMITIISIIIITPPSPQEKNNPGTEAQGEGNSKRVKKSCKNIPSNQASNLTHSFMIRSLKRHELWIIQGTEAS